MAFNPNYVIDNQAGISQDVIDLLLGVVNEAFRLWGEVLAGDADLTVRIELVESTAEGRAAATWGNGTNLGLHDGQYVMVGAPAYELQTGRNIEGGGHDVRILLSRDYLLNEVFLDPTPQTRGDVPSNLTDGLSVMLHEIGHALGFTGYFGSSYQGSYATTFDLGIADYADGYAFYGPNSERVLGGPVELTRDNWSHYGNSRDFPGDGDYPLSGLMNGVVFFRGYTYSIGELDLAMLADMGLGTILDDVLEAPLHDYLRGGLGNDRIYGSEIVNHLFGDEGDDLLEGKGGDDELQGGSGRDELFGGDGTDILLGGADADLLDGGTGDDMMEGGRGYDIYRVDSAGDLVIERPYEGQDTVVVSIDYTLPDEVENLTIANDAGARGTGNRLDNIITGGIGEDKLYGMSGDDTLSGDAGRDWIEGGNGNDTVRAGTENDTLIGNYGNDVLYGDEGNDRMLAGFGDDTAYGGDGRDEVRGGLGNDRLFGGQGDDFLYGGEGLDVVQGGIGYDWLYGGDGNDDLFGEDGNDRLQGEAGDDALDGGLGNDEAFGGIGNDTIDGGNGADVLRGGAGDDVIRGGYGFDSIAGGEGIDILTGGFGTDVFYFSSIGELGTSAAITDVITDFTQGQGDLIDLTGIDADMTETGDQAFAFLGSEAFTGTAGELRFYTDGGNTFVEFDVDGDGTADAVLRLDGLVDLTANDFVL